MNPSIGRIVLYKHDDTLYPAIITAVNTGNVTLTVFGTTWTETGLIAAENILPEQPNRTWCWPPRI